MFVEDSTRTGSVSVELRASSPVPSATVSVTEVCPVKPVVGVRDSAPPLPPTAAASRPVPVRRAEGSVTLSDVPARERMKDDRSTSLVRSGGMRTGTAEEFSRGRSSERAGTTTTAWPVSPSTSVTVYSTNCLWSPTVARIDWPSITWALGSSVVRVRSQGEPSASESLSRTGTVTEPSASTLSTVT